MASVLRGTGDNSANAAAADQLRLLGALDIQSGALLRLGNPNNLTTWADGDTAPKTLPFSFNILNNPPLYTLCAASAIQGTITYSARLTSVTGGATLGTNANNTFSYVGTKIAGTSGS